MKPPLLLNSLTALITRLYEAVQQFITVKKTIEAEEKAVLSHITQEMENEKIAALKQKIDSLS